MILSSTISLHREGSVNNKPFFLRLKSKWNNRQATRTHDDPNTTKFMTQKS